jgi:4-hydroxymandelate oxidase
VYRAAAPARRAAPARLELSGAWRRAFAAASDSARDPALRVYVADMLRPYGLDLAEDRLIEGQSYGEMAGTLLADHMAAQDPVDFLVFAFAVPDVAPWRATACYLSHLCPGQPFAFAVCDQGVIAPFTALRLIREYAGTGGGRRALLVVAEQAAMPYRQAAPAAAPASHAVVALLWDQGEDCAGTGRAGRAGGLERVRLHAGISRPQACRLLAEAAADLPDTGDLTTVVGTGLAGDAVAAGLPGRVIIAPPRQPSTGVWWEVAAGLSGMVLVADYDPGLGQLGLAAIEMPGERP